MHGGTVNFFYVINRLINYRSLIKIWQLFLSRISQIKYLHVHVIAVILAPANGEYALCKHLI